MDRQTDRQQLLLTDRSAYRYWRTVAVAAAAAYKAAKIDGRRRIVPSSSGMTNSAQSLNFSLCTKLRAKNSSRVMDTDSILYKRHRKTRHSQTFVCHKRTVIFAPEDRNGFPNCRLLKHTHFSAIAVMHSYQ